MPSSGSAIELRDATPADLHGIHGLLCDALPHDRFSADLLREKLFENPRPDVDALQTRLAVAGGELLAVQQRVLRLSERRAWLGLFATSGEHRRRGVATRLFEEALADWKAAGVATIDVLGRPGNYFAPGLDPRYTPALSWLERCGFARYGDCANLTSDLTGPLATDADEQRLRAAGIEIRRATPADRPLLDAFFVAHFGADWRLEAELSFRNDPPALHLALQGGQVLAFSAHSTQNREWGFFGPMGTAPAARGSGVGRVLLLRCLADLQRAGHRTAVIPWVGPISFYARCVPTVVERIFWRYRRTLTWPADSRPCLPARNLCDEGPAMRVMYRADCDVDADCLPLTGPAGVAGHA